MNKYLHRVFVSLVSYNKDVGFEQGFFGRNFQDIVQRTRGCVREINSVLDECDKTLRSCRAYRELAGQDTDVSDTPRHINKLQAYIKNLNREIDRALSSFPRHEAGERKNSSPARVPRSSEKVDFQVKINPEEKHLPIYFFGVQGDDLPPSGSHMKEWLGGKGAGLALMANEKPAEFEKWLRKKSREGPHLRQGFGEQAWLDQRGITKEQVKSGVFQLRVPPGFTITSEQTKLWNERREKGEA